MKSYELLYILSADTTDEQREALINKFSAVVTDNGGSVEKLDKWGMRKFAYPINFKTEGYYVLTVFKAEANVVSELSRQLRITDGVVRNMILALDEAALNDMAREVKNTESEAKAEEKAEAEVKSEEKTEEQA